MNPRVINIENHHVAEEELKKLRVSTHGIRIMAPKAIHRVIKISGIDPRAANIVKQEMLSRGGEAAAPWDLYKMDLHEVDMILMGTLRQFDELCQKLSLQPFGLPKLAQKIVTVLSNYDSRPPVLRAGRFTIDLSAKTHIMGVLNVTPDSFSDAGRFFERDIAIAHARQMVSDGADIIDIGGESTRPGAEPVSLEEELNRTIPVIEALAGKIDIPISIDTYKPEVAKMALDAGASIINDISGLRNEGMIKVAVEHNVPVIIMHMKGTPRDMQLNPSYEDVVAEICDWLDRQAEKAVESGLDRNKILIDPGIGFGKTMEHNLQIINRLAEFKSLGYPIVLGTSRKAFIGKILDLGPEERVEGTIASVVYGITQGANIVRVHDVINVARACKVADAIKRQKS
ncbi:MAG: dihydropteroate synthase [Firmicutes bacterium]|nr:dihydropteroate synthase [Bacillota bacterium]